MQKYVEVKENKNFFLFFNFIFLLLNEPPAFANKMQHYDYNKINMRYLGNIYGRLPATSPQRIFK